MSTVMPMQSPWWEAAVGDPLASQTVTSVVVSLRTGDSLRRTLYRSWDLMYDGDSLVGAAGNAIVDDTLRILGETTFNYAARALDMVHAKVTAEIPHVRADGRGADYAQHLRAQGLSHFIEGVTRELGLDDLLAQAAHCALRVGTAGLMAGFDDGEPTLEVIHPREFLVDPDDAMHGDPRCLYRVQPVDRRAALTMYPERTADIMAAGCASQRDSSEVGRPGDWTAGSTTGRVSDSVDLIDAWVLPDGDSPGRWIRCVDAGPPLLDLPWDVPRFPVHFLRCWDPAVSTGFWGRGLMERLSPGQLEVDELLTHELRQMKFSNTWAFLPDDADIAEGSLTDTVPDGINVVRVKDGAGNIQFVNPPVLGPEVLTVLAQLKADIYAMAGTTESAVGSQSPAGITSGIAIRTYHDFQAQAHVDIVKRIGRAAIGLVDRLLDAARTALGDDPEAQGSWEVRHPTLDVIRWADVDMDRDVYVIGLDEVSPVPDTRAGALQEVEEDAAAGRIPPEYLTRLREDPDRWWMDRCNAKEDVEFVDWTVERLMDPRLPPPELPDEAPLDLMIDRLRREILSAVRHARPDAVIERLRAHAHAAVELRTALTPPAPVASPATAASPLPPTPEPS